MVQRKRLEMVEGVTVETEADEIADAVVKRLAAEGYDAFRPGGYHDISGFVRRAIVEEIVKTLEENRRLRNEVTDLKAACRHYIEQAKKAAEILIGQGL